MTKHFTAICLFLLLTPAFSFAESQGTYFIDNTFTKAKSVQMLGALNTPENQDRESHIGDIIEANSNRLQFCYERALAGGTLPRVESVIYFTTGANGKFSNITADLLNMDSPGSNVKQLFSCISNQMNSFRAANWDLDKTFRLLLTFENRR